jgi:hypothetical protein
MRSIASLGVNPIVRGSSRATILLLSLALIVGVLRAGGPENSQLPPRRIAVLPVHNLGGPNVPGPYITQLLSVELQFAGMSVMHDHDLAEFLRDHRVRWMGGLNARVAQAFSSETDVEAVLVTSVDAYREEEPPIIGMTLRLVSTEPSPRILWMDSLELAGNQHLGALNMGRVVDPAELVVKAVGRAVASVKRFLDDKDVQRPPWRPRGRFFPKSQYGSLALIPSAERPLRVAVVPFLADDARDRSGEILMLQFVRHLTAARVLEVVEPGVVRDALLQTRVIQSDGVSYAQAEALRALMRLDAVVSGRVSEYREGRGEIESPEVGFVVRVLNPATRQVAWSSISYNRGHDNAVFYDNGRAHSAHELAFEMARTVVYVMTDWTESRVKKRRAQLALAAAGPPP